MALMKYRSIRFFTKGALSIANASAIARGAKQALAPEVISAMPDDYRIPVYQYHPLTEGYYRASLIMNGHGDIALLDVPRLTIERLPVARVLVPEA